MPILWYVHPESPPLHKTLFWARSAQSTSTKSAAIWFIFRPLVPGYGWTSWQNIIYLFLILGPDQACQQPQNLMWAVFGPSKPGHSRTSWHSAETYFYSKVLNTTQVRDVKQRLIGLKPTLKTSWQVLLSPRWQKGSLSAFQRSTFFNGKIRECQKLAPLKRSLHFSDTIGPLTFVKRAAPLSPPADPPCCDRPQCLWSMRRKCPSCHLLEMAAPPGAHRRIKVMVRFLRIYIFPNCIDCFCVCVCVGPWSAQSLATS